MTRGRPAKPTELKRLQGNPGKRPIQKSTQPLPKTTAPAMPSGLPSLAKKFFKEFASPLEEMGILTGLDGPALVFTALHYSIAVEAAKEIKRDGLTAVDENGAERKHPLLQVLKDNSVAYLRYAREFGLTPSARAGLKIPEPPEIDPFEEFLNG